jgi:tRNA dimethylallyltransferase
MPLTPRQTAPLLILAGPTGVGKSDLALAVARRWGGAIVSADSMQVYRGLAIGTAQPSAGELAEIPHRLVGHVDPTEPYDAARFVAEAEEAVAELRDADLIPLIVGGTGMYLKSLTEGLFEGPSRDPETRRRLHAEAEASGPEALHERLAAVDPEAAARIMPRDTMRIVRALEVFETTGRPLSAWHADSRREGPRHVARYVIVTRDREDLYHRIDTRVRRMLDAGWVDEVRGLLRDGVSETAPAFRALGYREILAHLRGELAGVGLEPAIAQTSRKYAKRQLTWFRAVKDAEWIDLTEVESGTGEKDLAEMRLARAWGLE